MNYWAPAPEKREQMVLFPRRLDEAVPPDHPVRLLDVILGQLSWTRWESRYHGRLGQPPIHPRVLAGVLLYGLLTRIRSSRCLEDALHVRLDFRWLAEGRTIDYTTISEFRRKYGAELKDLFVQAGETVPSRIPLTDPQSRMTPNKEGGFAPNYTPLATVDVESGLIVSADVIAMTDEDKYLVAAIEDVQEQFGQETPSPEMLADGMMATTANLMAMEERGVSLYSPIAIPEPTVNPAVRDDPTLAVPQEEWDRLPMKKVTVKGEKRQQLDKVAFIYDEERNCYWCPQGQALEYVHTTSEPRGGRRLIRDRYKADPQDCAGCLLRERCLQGKGKQRQISREPPENLRQIHARKMATPEAKQKYVRRRHPGERPFAVIKHHFGARRFLLRGLDCVRTEWNWLATAFNLQRLMNLIQSRAGPTAPATIVP